MSVLKRSGEKSADELGQEILSLKEQLQKKVKAKIIIIIIIIIIIHVILNAV